MTEKNKKNTAEAMTVVKIATVCVLELQMFRSLSPALNEQRQNGKATRTDFAV